MDIQILHNWKQTKPCFYSQFFVARENYVELKQDVSFQGTAMLFLSHSALFHLQV